MELLWEITGWAGAAAMLSAYMAVSMGWLKAGKTFQTVNLFGSCAFIINGTLHGAWPSVATNVAWFAISAIALLRMRAGQQPPVVTAETGPIPILTVPDAGEPSLALDHRGHIAAHDQLASPRGRRGGPALSFAGRMRAKKLTTL
ncbi:CBU_0592 family membrane protein [Paenarthrobacter sp. NCHU4564]|uniref:CBU_0592 family membrane protein n=1 Tax=Paenarthrobacter sp. NCHU4564 TaxID=3451353 RepID=UPI003F9575AD